ncbi:MAG: FGGY-family carbohydrate kinase, partial [Leptospirales bacterium]
MDLGTSGCKTALVDPTGAVLAWEFSPVELLILPHGGAEQDPEDWWVAFLSSAGRLIRGSGVGPGAIQAIVCSTQGECTVPVDERGHALMNAVLWMDMRGEAAVRRNVSGRFRIGGYDAFKLLRWIRLTGGAPALSGKDPAGHMLMIKESYPQVYRRTHKFLNALDYLNLRLCGRFVATPDSILTSWVTDNRRLGRIAYDAGLMRLSGVDPEKIPELVAGTDQIGTLLPTVAKELGLSADTRVFAGSIDTAAAAIGCGAVADYEPHLYIGTSAWLAAHVPFKKTDVFSGIASVPGPVADRYLMIAAQTTAGGNLAYLKERILYHKDELLRDVGVPDVYKILDLIAERTPAGSRGLIYTPWLYGERCPLEDGTVRAGIMNLSLEHSREDIIRAFLEGVALNTRWMLEPVRTFLRRKPEAITIAGGGGASRVWCRIFADVLGMRVRQLEQPVQANAVGAAAIARVGMGQATFAELAQHTSYRAEYEPNPRNAKVYDQSFEVCKEIYFRLKPIYRRLNGG